MLVLVVDGGNVVVVVVVLVVEVVVVLVVLVVGGGVTSGQYVAGSKSGLLAGATPMASSSQFSASPMLLGAPLVQSVMRLGSQL